MTDKYKINLVGDSFTHLTGGNKGYSVAGKESKYIQWANDSSLQETVYVDNWIPLAFSDNVSGTKYAWLLESKYVTPEIVKDIEENYLKYFETFKYIFTHNKHLLNLDNRFKWVPANGYWIKEAKIYPKTKMISFITSNKNFTEGHKTRLEWVEKIGDQVDLYGRGFNEIESKEDGLCDYMFSVAIENGIYESYFTEKILDCFATGTIPIYLGTPDISDYFNKNGIIDLTDEFDVSEEIYYSKLNAIKENLEKVKEIEVLEDFIYKNYLEK
jgi:hypothetical protein